MENIANYLERTTRLLTASSLAGPAHLENSFYVVYSVLSLIPRRLRRNVIPPTGPLAACS